MKLSLKSTLATLLAISVIGFAVTVQAEDKPTEKKAEAPKADAAAKPKLTYYSGNLEALDKKAMTITIKKKTTEETFTFTSEAKIRKAGKNATLEDGVLGEPAGVGYVETDGKKDVKSIRFGAAVKKPDAPKADGEAKPEKKADEKM